MNIAEILKECPTGTKFYSPIFGEVVFVCVNDDKLYPIICSTIHGLNKCFLSDGRYYEGFPDSECTLFPSKDQRDWSKFKVSVQKPKPQFKPFDKVLVRDYNDNEWNCDFFSNMNEDGSYNCLNTWWNQCIHYEGNEHLLGTTNSPNSQ